MGSLLGRFLVGALAGLVGWAIMEPFAPTPGTEAWGRWESNFMLVYGCLIGLVIGGYDGLARGGKQNISWGAGLGLVLGAFGCILGYALGGSIVQATFGNIFDGVDTPQKMVPIILARTIVFALIGLFVGGAIGASSRTMKRTTQGAIGGLIGGLISGVLFDPIGLLCSAFILGVQGKTHGDVGGPSRAIGFTLMAAFIALFIGLVGRLTRSAWLRLNLGRNEGKEWSIDAPQTFIGRSEGASVPLFGDPNVAPMHAVIQKQGQQYVLTDGGSPVGTFVNGQRVQQVALAAGSVIQIGGFALQFLLKETPAPVMAPEAYRGQAYPISGQPQPQAYAPVPVHQPMPQPAMPMGNQTVAYAAPAAAAPPSPGFGLVALDGPMMGQRFPVRGPTEVGREASGIRLSNDGNASRRHASVSPTFSGMQVNDLGSTNGTYVNGQKVQSVEAHAGDVIKIGSTSFRVEAS